MLNKAFEAALGVCGAVVIITGLVSVGYVAILGLLWLAVGIGELLR